MRALPLLAILLASSSGIFASECEKSMKPLLESGDFGSASTHFDICIEEAESGEPEALYYLSFFYFGLSGFEANSAKGVEVMRTSAELGYGLAQYWMGWQYEVGTYLPQNFPLAISWYRKAASSEEWMAQERLARAYRNGELGLPVDEVLAKGYESDRR